MKTQYLTCELALASNKYKYQKKNTSRLRSRSKNPNTLDETPNYALFFCYNQPKWNDDDDGDVVYTTSFVRYHIPTNRISITHARIQQQNEMETKKVSLKDEDEIEGRLARSGERELKKKFALVARIAFSVFS